MLSLKGKSKANQTLILSDDPRAAFKNDFKIYSDTEKVVTAPNFAKTRTKSFKTTTRNQFLPVKEGSSQLDLSNLKGSIGDSQMGKSRRDSFAKLKVGRKVLSDIGNILSRNRQSHGSQPVKTCNEKSTYGQRKTCNEKSTYGQRVPLGQCTSIASSSRKSVMGMTRPARSRVDHRENKVCSESQRIKGEEGHGHKSFGTDGRKSLPVVRRANVIDTSDSKKTSEKRVGTSGNVKVGRKVLARGKNAGIHLLKNQVSDVSMSMKVKTARQAFSQRISARRNVVDAGTSSRKSRRPFGRTTGSVSRNETTSKSKSTAAFKKPTFAISNSSKIKGKSETETRPKNVAFLVSHETNSEKLSSDGNRKSSLDAEKTVSTGKSSRRLSFTSSLVAKSEVMKVCEEITKPKELPNIDDNLNHLEVAEYIDEIYRYYWVMEVQYPSMANYMTSQKNITPKMRGILINWLIEVHFKFDLMQETLFLMVALFDRFLSVETIEKNEIQLVGLTALLLASKYEDFWHPRVKDLVSVAADSYTTDQMLAMEKLILKKLMFRLNMPTPYVFMLRFLKAAQSETKLEHLSFYLIELCLVEYEALKFKPSLLCASAIYLARCTLEITPSWTPLLRKHACYEEQELRACAEMVLRFQKAVVKGHLKVTYDKYMSSDHCRVAAIKPLNRIPQ